MDARNTPYDEIPFFDDLVRFYEQSPLGLQPIGNKIMPGADIFCSGSASTTKRLSALLNVLCMMRKPDKTFPFTGIVVVYPLASAETLPTLTDRLRATAVSVMTRLHGDEAGEGFKAFLCDVLRVTTCPSLDANAAAELLEAIESGSAVIFVDAAKYRKLGLVVERNDGETIVTIEEDLWVRHLRAFAEACVTSARARETYVVLDAGQHSPYKAENQNILESVSGCGVLGSKIVGDSRGILVSKIEEWTRGIEAGLIGRVFSEIDALPDSLDPEKRFIKIQLLGRAKLAAQTLELLRQEVPTIPEDDPAVLVRYARFARDAGDSELCVKFLSAALPSLVAPEELELALVLST